MKQTVVLVGCGNMGFAMLQGWKSAMPDLDIHAVEPTKELHKRVSDLGCSIVSSVVELEQGLSPDLIVLAVKPQLVGDVVKSLNGIAGTNTAFLSVAAGVSTASMRTNLQNDNAVIRCMPNTPAAIGEGMMVLTAGAELDVGLHQLVDKMMACSGKVAWVDDEKLMDAVTAISGSGPAYVFHFVEALTDAGIELGLPAETASMLAKQISACACAPSGTDPSAAKPN